MSFSFTHRPFLTKTLFVSSLIIGFADGFAAIASAYLTRGVNPARAFQYIASGVLGSDAFSGGMPTVYLGIALHFFIAFSFTAFFTFLANKQKWLLDRVLLHGTLYGVFIWLTMNFIVIPLSRITTSGFNTTQVIVGLLIHIFVIGIPIVWFARRQIITE